MSPEHVVLQTIACYGRVNTGNFSELQRQTLEILIEASDVVLSTDGNDLWSHLTDKGKRQLYRFNSLMPSRFTCASDTPEDN